MQKEQMRNRTKEQLKSLFRGMDFVSNNFLEKEDNSEKDLRIFFDIYQQLGLAWEFLSLQCKHREGYKKTTDNKETCKICGKVKGARGGYYLLPEKGPKILGLRLKPNPKKILENKTKARIVNDTINFYGAMVNVDVHNSYKSGLLDRKHRIT
jgi:hypothetical protein